jgi:excisionase family DNA binding protein
MKDDPILTIQEVGEILKVAPRTIRQWIKDQKLKAFKLGGLVRIHREDLDEFIDRSRRPEQYYVNESIRSLGFREMSYAAKEPPAWMADKPERRKSVQSNETDTKPKRQRRKKTE